MRIILALSMALLASAVGDAHRLDEYLQASRVSVERARIVLDLALTPGVAVAANVIEHVDRDDDGQIALFEAESYGREVLGDLTASLDGASLTMTLLRVEVPTAGELRDGTGTIRIEAAANADQSFGRHYLTLENHHRPDESAYLANALMPTTSGISIVQQARDSRQQTFRLEYEIGPSAGSGVVWLLVAGAVLARPLRGIGRRFAPGRALLSLPFPSVPFPLERTREWSLRARAAASALFPERERAGPR